MPCTCVPSYPVTSANQHAPLLLELLPMTFSLNIVDIRSVDRPNPDRLCQILSGPNSPFIVVDSGDRLAQRRTTCLRRIAVEFNDGLTDMVDFTRSLQARLEELRIGLWRTAPCRHVPPIVADLVMHDDDVWPHVHSLELKGLSVSYLPALAHAFAHVQLFRVYHQRRRPLCSKWPCVCPSLKLARSLDELIARNARTGRIGRPDFLAADIAFKFRGRQLKESKA